MLLTVEEALSENACPRQLTDEGVQQVTPLTHGVGGSERKGI